MRTTAVEARIVRPLRGQVLRPGQPADQLVFPGDEAAETLHVAVIEGGWVLGVGSVMRDAHPRDPQHGDWRIRGMASHPEARGRGIGAALLARCETHVREHGGSRLWCNARSAARSFYERGGLEVEGDEFDIPSIGAHYLMSKGLGHASGDERPPNA
jgi:GNAT superfamily N-acetyltransferase